MFSFALILKFDTVYAPLGNGSRPLDPETAEYDLPLEGKNSLPITFSLRGSFEAVYTRSCCID